MAAVTLTEPPEYVSPTSVRVRFDNGTPGSTYYLFQNGELVDTTTDNEYVFTVSAFDNTQIDIFDDSSDLPSLYSNRARLQWDSDADSAGYYVDEYVDSAWVQRQNLIVSALPVLTFRSRALLDGTTYQFRIRSNDAQGNAGASWIAAVPMICRPSHETLSIALLAGANLRLSSG